MPTKEKTDVAADTTPANAEPNDTTKSIADPPSAANGRAHNGQPTSAGADPFDTPMEDNYTPPTEDDRPDEPPATALTGDYFAFAKQLDPSDELDVLGKTTAKALRKFARQHKLDPPECLAELPAIPVHLVAEHLDDVPSRAEVAKDAADQGVDDPHDVLERLKRERFQRIQEQTHTRIREQAETAPIIDALRTAEIDPGTEYTLGEIARAHPDAAWVESITASVRNVNIVLRATDRYSKPRLTVTALELSKFGATPGELAALRPADNAALAEAVDYAEEQLLLADADRRDRVKDEQRRAKLRGEGYVALQDAFFDFDRDFAALRAPEELIPGLIETSSAVQLIAKPNVGKTFLALAWACSLAMKGQHVIYIVADDSTYQFTRRVLGWCAAHDAEPRGVLAFLKLTTRAAQFADSDDVSALAATVKANNSVMVVFDTQHQCSEGLVENSNDDSRVIISACKRLTKLGAAVLVVHHTLDGSTGRGAKSVEGALDTTLAVTETERDGKHFLKVTENKQKNMAKDDPKLYPYDVVEIPPALRGTVVPDRHKFTKVVHTGVDPFDTAAMNEAEVIRSLHICSVLWALKSSTVPLAVTRISKLSREWAKPRLGAKDLLTQKGNLPKGFSDGDVMRTLKALSDDTGTKLVDPTASTSVTARYELTPSGESELERLTEALEPRA